MKKAKAKKIFLRGSSILSREREGRARTMEKQGMIKKIEKNLLLCLTPHFIERAKQRRIKKEFLLSAQNQITNAFRNHRIRANAHYIYASRQYRLSFRIKDERDNPSRNSYTIEFITFWQEKNYQYGIYKNYHSFIDRKNFYKKGDF